MAAHLSDLPVIVVTGEANWEGNTAHIAEFGARLRSDLEETYVLSTSHDAHQVEGFFLSDTPDSPFQSNHPSCTPHHLAYHQTLQPITLASSDNSYDGSSPQLDFRQLFSADHSPGSTFSDFGTDDSSSSNCDLSATPSTSPSIHSSEIGTASPHLNDCFVQISLHDAPTPVSQSYGDAGDYLRPRCYSDVTYRGRPQASNEAGHGRSISYSGSHRPAFNCSTDSRIIDRMPHVTCDNGLGLTFDAIYQGSATALGVGPSDGQGVSSQPIATAGGEAPYTSDAGRLSFAEQRQPLYVHASLTHSTISPAPNSHVPFRPAQPPRSIQGLPLADHGRLRDSLKLKVPTDTSGGFCDGPHSAPASYTGDRAHFPVGLLTRQASAPGELRLSTDTARWKPDNLESHCLSPLGMDADSGFSGGPRSAAASYTGERNFPAEWLMRRQPQGLNPSSGGPYSTSASYTWERTDRLTPQASAPSHFQSFFEDDMMDPMCDIEHAAASSAISDWSVETPGFPSCSKKTVSTAKLRKASAKRRKKPGRFICSDCGSTFTEKHNLANHFNSHLGIKPFICDRCSRGFGVASSLNRHRGTCKEPKLT